MYTKKQRRDIYYKALKAFTKKTNVGFMCHELSKAINTEAPFVYYDRLLELFPEWANCRPIGFKYGESTGESNVWEDDETKGYSIAEFNQLRETILCLSIAQL